MAYIWSPPEVLGCRFARSDMNDSGGYGALLGRDRFWVWTWPFCLYRLVRFWASFLGSGLSR